MKLFSQNIFTLTLCYKKIRDIFSIFLSILIWISFINPYSFASEQEIPASEITPVATTTTEITTEEIPEINLEQFNSQIDQIQQTITLISERVSELVPYWGTTKAHERFVMLQNEVEKVTDSMQASYKKLEKIAIRMNITTQELKKTAEEIFSLKNSIKETQQTIVLMTEILFKLNNELTDKNYQIDDIKLFLKSDNISEPLSHDFLLQSLVAKMDELLGKLEQDKTNNLNLGKNLISMRATIKQDMTDSATTIQMLKQKQNYILEFLSLYKDNKIPAGIWITDLFESRKDVQLKIAETMKLIAEWASPLTFDFASRLSELNQTVERPFGDHFFSWPLQPVNNILSFFQDPSYQEKFGITNMGVDLSSSQLNPIYAPADGVVYRVVDKDWISLNWLVIAHKYWYSSAFAYMNSILVKEGELVSRWQLLWYSWWEPGTRGAWFSSQGSLLHFELAKDGIAIDPLLNLDLSLIPDQKLLPDTYQVKYLRNVADRAERRQGITFIEGANVFERRSNYLAKFWTPPYNTATFREKASEWSNIDIDLGLCIGMAESSLGKFLSTANNIWNVWNNDRWDRIPYDAPMVGAGLIYKTLNNQFLWAYHRIDELSGFWNKEWKVYASSPINWQNNVVKCLSTIKGYYVPEDYPFRTAPNPNFLDPNFSLAGSWSLISEAQ